MIQAQFLRQWIDRYEERRALRHEMYARLGILLRGPASAETQRDIRATMLKCDSCAQTDDCRSWLALGGPVTGPPSFCPARAAFLRLMTQPPPTQIS